MRTLAPPYYKAFRCIADKCKYSCCVGWGIDIDNASLMRYSSPCHPMHKELTECIDIFDEGACFKTDGDGRCRMLDDNGLCRIISCLGEGELCDICTNHPRFYNVRGNIIEAGLGMCCEEACRLIISEDGYGRLESVNTPARLGGIEALYENSNPGIFDLSKARGEIYEILCSRDIPYKARLQAIYEKCGFSELFDSGDSFENEIRMVLSGLEYMNESFGKRLACEFSLNASPALCDTYLERALGYFIYRHTGENECDGEFINSLRLALLLERMLASMLNKQINIDINGIIESARELSEEIEYNEDNIEELRMFLL